jgi:DNA-directed RNA polymerase specialized sigma24 family protein
LPDRFRELLVLRELEEFSYQEMADVLNIPIGTVMSRLSRARRAFARALERESKTVQTTDRTTVPVNAGRTLCAT